ncbi:MAG: hypothetical protein J2P45_23030 [Candidatus Dormibacteraeota bacterium]|nr:hypothetical protein [Candidatus Dormibacteraeota bacterium]
MGDWVSADGAAKQQATQLQTHINGELKSSLSRLNQLSNQLAQNPKFNGRYANQYRHDIVPPLHQSTKQLQDKLEQLAPELNRIINHILQAGGSH